jgi:hypothetical protein
MPKFRKKTEALQLLCEGVLNSTKREYKNQNKENIIKVENIETFNWESAILGMRNPLESWDKSDSKYDLMSLNYVEFVLGENDKKLALQLVKAGSDHRKFMRQIFVSMDITAPLYFYKEFDTYKIGTVANSTSTMHKLSTTPITLDCFSFDETENSDTKFVYSRIIDFCEHFRNKYLESKNEKYWRTLIQILPSAWNQTRTWTANYEVLRNIYHARKNHKLQEWVEFCKIIETLPNSELITIEGN